MTETRDLDSILSELLDVQHIIAELRDDLIATLGERLLGLYLYGSAVWGDFDPEISDLDLTAVVASEITDADLPALEQMHADFVTRHPSWNGRVEVQYITPRALQSFREHSSSMANISPGEPLHIIQAGVEWLTNWYFIQDYGVVLYGPPAATFIPPISDAEFRHAVYERALGWPEYVKDARENVPGQGYAVLTMCRALFTVSTGKQVSKQKAAAWAMETYPEDADLIRRALVWRSSFRAPQEDPALTYPLVENYVKKCVARISNSVYTTQA